ncbi:epoxide hydratase [Cystobacter fuscus]|uniref:Epoxide hydratase n=1 Tax=Cystobacter fuscus TaxID=43 RepID=A0A250J7J4_9BACT|nr:epoxide hydrolase family protein [Cystobacter fuscus]ATB39487.1 epoxide hydratase [Cystobacter fuscus]
MRSLEDFRFQIDVGDDVLSDLRQRLSNTRFAPDLDNDDMKYGLSTAYLKPFIEHWRDRFDWRTAEAAMNGFNQYRIEIDGTPVHFIYEKGRGPSPTPILLLHGWPWTFWMWRDVIRPLSDPASFGGDPRNSFDVIVPSLPGFGFSAPVGRGDLNHWKMADLFHTLMTRYLGYERYAASGGDYGALISSQLGHKYASSLFGIHLGHDLIPAYSMDDERPWDLTGGQMIPSGTPEALRQAILRFQDTLVSHVAVHMLDGQTITHGLNDSPAGLLAWLLKRWHSWSDHHVDLEDRFSKDEVLTHATIYWVTQTIGSSIRAYKNANLYKWKPSHDRRPQIETPAGFTFLLSESYPPGATKENRVEMFRSGPTSHWFNPVNIKVHERGGHFGPWENPGAYIADIRETFSIIRGR